MRILVGLLIIACVTGFFYSHRSVQEPVAPSPAPVVSAAAQTATPREPSEHNWAKRSLDRAADVKRQVAEQRKSNDVP